METITKAQFYKEINKLGQLIDNLVKDNEKKREIKNKLRELIKNLRQEINPEALEQIKGEIKALVIQALYLDLIKEKREIVEKNRQLAKLRRQAKQEIIQLIQTERNKKEEELKRQEATTSSLYTKQLRKNRDSLLQPSLEEYDTAIQQIRSCKPEELTSIKDRHFIECWNEVSQILEDLEAKEKVVEPLSDNIKYYKNLFEDSHFFDSKGNNTFGHMYTILTMMAMINDEEYNPEEFLKKLTELLIINPLSKIREGEKEINLFWRNQVGRPSVRLKKAENGEVVKDSLGLPIVENIENEDNVNYAVAKEHGKYLFLRRVEDSLNLTNPQTFAILTAYHQLDQMINGRRKKENIGIEDVPLPKREFYYITVCKDNRWKKIKINGDIFASEENGLESFIKTFKTQLAEESGWNEFDLEDLQKQAEAAYSENYSYQEIETQLSDLADFTAADFGIVFTNHQINENNLISSLLTNTYGGHKQMNIVFGLKQNQQLRVISQIISHRYIDGKPAEAELNEVLNQAYTSYSQTSDQETSNIEPMNIENYQEDNEFISHVYPGIIEVENFRERCNSIYTKYKEKLQIKIDKNTIVQMAIHIVLKLNYTHFLESRDGMLFPAISFIPKRVLNKLVDNEDLTIEEMSELVASTLIMRLDRKSEGIVPTMAMLSGEGTTGARIREIITSTGEKLHEEITKPLVESSLTSSLSRRIPEQKNVNFPEVSFVTAMDGVYSENGSFGFFDLDGGKVGFTYRTIRNNEADQNIEKRLNSAILKILSILELYIDSITTTES